MLSSTPTGPCGARCSWRSRASSPPTTPIASTTTRARSSSWRVAPTARCSAGSGSRRRSRAATSAGGPAAAWPSVLHRGRTAGSARRSCVRPARVPSRRARCVSTRRCRRRTSRCSCGSAGRRSGPWTSMAAPTSTCSGRSTGSSVWRGPPRPRSGPSSTVSAARPEPWAAPDSSATTPPRCPAPTCSPRATRSCPRWSSATRSGPVGAPSWSTSTTSRRWGPRPWACSMPSALVTRRSPVGSSVACAPPPRRGASRCSAGTRSSASRRRSASPHWVAPTVRSPVVGATQASHCDSPRISAASGDPATRARSGTARHTAGPRSSAHSPASCRRCGPRPPRTSA